MSRAKLPSYDAQNLAIARQFLADPEQYGGEASGRLEWARMVVERLSSEAIPMRQRPAKQATIFGSNPDEGDAS